MQCLSTTPSVWFDKHDYFCIFVYLCFDLCLKSVWVLNVVMRSKRGDVSSSVGASRSSGLQPHQDQPPPGPMISPRHPNQDKFPAQALFSLPIPTLGKKESTQLFHFSPLLFIVWQHDCSMMKEKTQIEQASTMHFRSSLISVEIQPTERVILFVLRRQFLSCGKI